MKTLLVLSASLFATSIAHAEPAVSTTATTASTEPASYLAAGVLLGGDHAIVGAVTLDGGYQLRGSLFLHGLVAKGTAAGVDEPNYSSSYDAARIGLEERACLVDALCGYAGLDVGVRHVDYMAEDDNTNTTGVVVIPRFGLDVGSSHLRFRPGIEGIIDGSHNHSLAGFDGVDLTAAVAYRW
jgi:hypothetical protein